MKNSLCLVLLLSACSSSSTPATPDAYTAGPDAEAAVDVGTPTRGAPDAGASSAGCGRAAALCGKLEACAPFFLKAGYGDLPSCTDRLTKVCTEQSKANGSGMTEAALAACEAALTQATCSDVFANKVSACVFHGALADGDACGDHGQCASGLCKTGGALCGVCTPKGGVGAACASGSNDECQTGLVCSSGKICATPAALGGLCDEKTQPCVSGTFCTSANTCASMVPAGAECPGIYLNFTDGTLCTGKGSSSLQLGTAAPGKDCGLLPGDGVPPTLCAPGGVAACAGLVGSSQLLGIPTKGICTAPIEDAFNCTANSDCLTGSQCINGTCRIPSGMYCTSSP
jgi:hypothetical protein